MEKYAAKSQVKIVVDKRHYKRLEYILMFYNSVLKPSQHTIAFLDTKPEQKKSLHEWLMNLDNEKLNGD